MQRTIFIQKNLFKKSFSTSPPPKKPSRLVPFSNKTSSILKHQNFEAITLKNHLLVSLTEIATKEIALCAGIEDL